MQFLKISQTEKIRMKYKKVKTVEKNKKEDIVYETD